jgi:uncharacterized protein YdhG (YjbR/CyaY superfamily)
MVQSQAKDVAAYLAELPPERRAVVAAVRDVVLAHLPAGYREAVGWGMITWSIPLERYPDTYNKQPLCFAALAAQKSHYSLYLTCVYQERKLEEALREAFEKAGKKLDMGKSCVRFRRLEDLPLAAIGEMIASVPPEAFIASYERVKGPPAAQRGKVRR